MLGEKLLFFPRLIIHNNCRLIFLVLDQFELNINNNYMKVPPPTKILIPKRKLTKKRRNCVVSSYQCNICRLKLSNRYQAEIHQMYCAKKYKPSQIVRNQVSDQSKRFSLIKRISCRLDRRRRAFNLSKTIKKDTRTTNIKLSQIDILQSLKIDQFPIPNAVRHKLRNRQTQNVYNCRFCKLASSKKSYIRKHQNNHHFLQHQSLSSSIVEKICSFEVEFHINSAPISCSYDLVSIYPGAGSRIFHFYKCQFCSYVNHCQYSVQKHLASQCNNFPQLNRQTDIIIVRDSEESNSDGIQQILPERQSEPEIINIDQQQQLVLEKQPLQIEAVQQKQVQQELNQNDVSVRILQENEVIQLNLHQKQPPRKANQRAVKQDRQIIWLNEKGTQTEEKGLSKQWTCQIM